MADNTPDRPEQDVVDRIAALIDDQLAAGELIPIELDDLDCACGDVWHGFPRNGCPGTPVAGEHPRAVEQIRIPPAAMMEPAQEPTILPWLAPQRSPWGLVYPSDAEAPDVAHTSQNSLIDQVHIELPDWILDCIDSQVSMYQPATVEERLHEATAMLEYFSARTLEAARRNVVLIAIRDGWRMTFRSDGVVDVVHEPPTVEELLGSLLDDPRFSAAAAHYRDVLGRVPQPRRHWRFLIGR